MAEMDVIRVPRSWKQALLTLREAIPEETGAALVGRLAAIAETNPLTVSSLFSHDTPTAIAAPTIQGRAVPSSLAAMVGELVELHRYNPQAARGILQAAMASHVENHPTPPPEMPQGHVRFCLVNEYLASDIFTIRGRPTRIPVGKELLWPVADVEAIEGELATRKYNHGRNAGYYTKVTRLE